MYPNEHFLKKNMIERIIFFSNFLEIGPDFYLVLRKFSSGVTTLHFTCPADSFEEKFYLKK